MKRRYIAMAAASLLAFALLTGCGSGMAGMQTGGNTGGNTGTEGGSSQREAELQAEIDSLRQELDELKNAQGNVQGNAQESSQSQQAADDGQVVQDGGAGKNTNSSDAAPSQGGNGSTETQNSGQASSGSTQISMEEAIRIALDRVPGATEQDVSIELERDDGWLIYEGDILYNRMEYEFEIDARSGNMLKWEEEAW